MSPVTGTVSPLQLEGTDQELLVEPSQVLIAAFIVLELEKIKFQKQKILTKV